jgi:hypothetical protein
MFSALGYSARAYHNHTYTYYDRDSSYPNMVMTTSRQWFGHEKPMAESRPWNDARNCSGFY